MAAPVVTMPTLSDGARMRRRDFIKLLGGATAANTSASETRAQPSGKAYRLGALVQAPRTAAHWIAFFDELGKQGFVEGLNLTVVDAFNTPLDRADAVATTIVNARPDAIVTAGVLT